MLRVQTSGLRFSGFMPQIEIPEIMPGKREIQGEKERHTGRQG